MGIAKSGCITFADYTFPREPDDRVLKEERQFLSLAQRFQMWLVHRLKGELLQDVIESRPLSSDYSTGHDDLTSLKRVTSSSS